MTQKVVKDLKPKIFLKFIQFHGYTFIRHSGSHSIYKKSGALRPLVIPIHAKAIKPGVISSNLKSMGLTMADLYDFCHKLTD